MKHLKLIALLFCILTPVCITQAQTDKKVDLSKSLRVGDAFIPPTAVEVMRGLDKTIDWKKLKDKVVILDFFDTFCGTCIQTMPKLQKLQDKLKDKLQIITVGWQNKATLDDFFAKNAFLKENKVNLPVIYSDVYLKQLFPHKGVPHVVFLFKGKVHAIAVSNLITEENILKLFNTGSIDIPLKNDFGKGNLVGQQSDESPKMKEGVWISGYQNGVPFQSLVIKQDSISGLIKTSFYNVSIYSAILFNWAKVKKVNYIPRAERLVLKVKDPNRYQDFSKEGEAWSLKNGISYERLDRVQRSDSAQSRLVLNDLHSFFGIRSYKTMQEIDCLILQPCPIKAYTGNSSESKMNFANSSVLAVMTDLGEKFPPVLDLVNSKEEIIIGDYETLEELNAQLAAYGIEAILGRGMQEVLVIEEVNE
ncbi:MULTISPECIES: TlpA family protein disulfide reductase [Sphingobacterium]|uniref:TlpA family protein disulfide reductase n=1 Tax=Sphingobacterium TaxID=28453 RepID=UPI00104A8C2D|nr:MULTISPECIES: TlpA family protein disulfide reductase [Sphingobacterium]MCW2259599.1 thiol-disulfide isomerase/thioredoxin [Sphingobacterium kitahiroshimense]TCR13958.1 redoxin [Sphingobacterium sp. JUb78]